MKKNTIVRHCFSRKYISLCIFLLLGIIGEKAFAYSVWETYANETEGIYFSLQELPRNADIPDTGSFCLIFRKKECGKRKKAMR